MAPEKVEVKTSITAAENQKSSRKRDHRPTTGRQAF
jgi:hypothetical protein